MSDNRGIGRNVTQKIKRAAAVEPLEGRLCFSVFAAGYALPLAGTRMESLRPRATTFEQHERSLFTRAALAATAAAANCDPSGPAAATSAASTTASAAVAPTRFAQKIAVSRADELRELFVRIDPRPEIRIAERLFLERAQRFERQTAPPPAPGTSSGEARGSDDSVGSTVGSAVTPATPVSAPPVVELIVIEQVLVVPAPPPTTTEAGGAPATKGTAAGRNVTPQAAGDSPATAAVTTAVVRPVLSAAAALRASAVGASTSAAVSYG